MRKFFLIVLSLFLFYMPAYAAKIPAEVKKILDESFYGKEEIRFDGLITLPDSTVYLPLYPARIKKPESVVIKQTYPVNKKLKDLPEIVIFNNDFVLMKVIKDKDGNRTFANPNPMPIEVKTGLLPQDLLVPKGLIVPESMKTVIGSLKIQTKEDPGLRVKSDITEHLNPVVIKSYNKNLVKEVSELKNKNLYIATCYSKNIQVVEGENSTPKYALTQKSIPIDMKLSYDSKYLLVTVYNSNYVDVISLKDEQIIKRIELQSQPEEIIVDNYEKKAYVSSPSDSSIYVIDLKTMLLKQKIKVNGMCERLYLTDDSTKLFYHDKNTGIIWVIDIYDDYKISEIGTFPNVSKIVFTQNKVYMLSRTQNKLAIVDYVTKGLLQELDVPKTPIDMIVHKNNLVILGGSANEVMILDTKDDVVISRISLNTNGFATTLTPVKNTDIVLVTDTKVGKYCVLNVSKKLITKTNNLFIPVSRMVIIDKKYGSNNK